MPPDKEMRMPYLFRNFCLLACLAVLGSSCTAFKQEKLFQSEETVNSVEFTEKLEEVEEGYLIKRFDILAIAVFPNNGEQLVDQTGDYPTNGQQRGGNNQMMGGGSRNSRLGSSNDPVNTRILPFNNMRPMYYNVNDRGELELPVVGTVQAEGLKLIELDSLLQEKYASYIKEPYVVSQFVNKRVVLMGALGDRVVPLINNGTSLLEVLSISTGGGAGNNNISSLQQQAKASEIRIIRGQPGEREVILVDLTTIAGLNKLQTNIQPNDIVYVPPRRRFDRQTLTDISAVFTPILTALTLLTSIISFTRSN